MKQIVLSSLFFLLFTGLIHGTIDFETLQQEDSLLYYRNLSSDKNFSFENRLDANSKAIILARQISDSAYLSQLSYKSTIYGAAINFDEALTQAQFLLKESLRINQKYFIALSYEKLGRYLARKQNNVDAFKNYIRSIELYSEIGDSLSIIKVSKRASFIQINFGDLDGAEFTIVKALDYSNSLTDVSELSWFYDILGRVYRERSLWQEAIRYHRKALQLETSPVSKVTLLNNYALTLLKADNFHEAIIQLEVALAYGSEIGDKTRYRLLDNYAFAKAKLGEPEAITLLENALNHRKEFSDLAGQYASHIHLSEAYGNLNNSSKSRYHAQQAYDIATQLKNTEATVKALDFLIPVTKKSNKLFEEYSILSDSLKEVQNNAKFEFAKLRYDVEKAEERESVALQLQSASELREEIAMRKRNWAFILLLGIGLLTVVFILYQKERSKKQRLLDQFNTEKRIAKKLHDELANEIYLVMTQLESDKTTPQVADKLEHIYKLSRDISRETQPIQTGDSFPSELALSLQTYTTNERKLILRGLELIDWKSLDPTKKIEIYRVLQELMTNMRKHSNASFVALVFKEEKQSLKINYSDNGRGTTLSPQNRIGGLNNTKTRLRSVNGEITFDSTIDEGFRAELTIPI